MKPVDPLDHLETSDFQQVDFDPNPNQKTNWNLLIIQTLQKHVSTSMNICKTVTKPSTFSFMFATEKKRTRKINNAKFSEAESNALSPLVHLPLLQIKLKFLLSKYFLC